MTATYDFSMTRNQIIRRALRIIGELKEDGEPTGDQMISGSIALESLVKWLQAEGLQLWTIDERELTLVIGQGTYDTTDGLGTDMLVVMHCRIWDSDNRAVMTGLVDDSVFRSVSEPTKTGRPEMVMVELRQSPQISFWPVPDQAYTWQYRVVRKLADFDSALGTPEMPQRWFDPLVYSLAANLADEKQRPLEERAYLQAKAQKMREIASNLDNDPSDAFYLRPI